MKFKVGDRVEFCNGSVHGNDGDVGVVITEETALNECIVRRDDGVEFYKNKECLKLIPSYQTEKIGNYPQWLMDIPKDEGVWCWVSDIHNVPDERDYRRLIHAYDLLHKYIATSGHWRYATPIEESVVDPEKEALQKRLLVAEHEIKEVREKLGKM